jgi:hypothetical protein
MEMVSLSRRCECCGNLHRQRTSPICASCRRKNSKKPCPVPGCEASINAHSRTCLAHRRHPQFQREVHHSCIECGAALDAAVSPVCDDCRQNETWLCFCGCGRYRSKYDRNGQVREYISGHNDNWSGNRWPDRRCDICGEAFHPNSSRQRFCGMECRNRWIAINPPNERKRVAVQCGNCGKIIYRTPSEMGEGRSYACSRECQTAIVSGKLSERISQGKKLALRRDDARCRICGFDAIVEVHHIIPRRDGGSDDPSNLITLCPNHHTMADRGLISGDSLRKRLSKA